MESAPEPPGSHSITQLIISGTRSVYFSYIAGWVILELSGPQDRLDDAVSYLREVGCTVNTMEGDVIEG